MMRYYEAENSNIHRGVHYLSERATESYEGVRVKVRQFMNAADVKEIIFVRGTTEAMNLVAHSFGQSVRQGRGRDPDLRDGAPLQHRAVADVV